MKIINYSKNMDNQTNKINDLVTIEQFLQGDEKAFEILVETYYKKIFNLCYRFFNNPEDATDATQEVFLKAYKYLKNFRQDSAFYTWLHRLAVNHCLTTINSKKRFLDKCKEYFALTFLPKINQSVYDPVKLVEDREFFDDLKKAITHLPPEFRMAVILRDVEGLAYEEIAEKLEVSLGTVKSRIARGRKILRELLAHYKDSKGDN